jgi:pyroglutamyl-peptidase
MKKILWTGFEPFGNQLINPSWEAIRLLPDQFEDFVFVKKRLPVSYKRVPMLLAEEISKENPDVILCLGQAGGRSGITPELIAINLLDAEIGDNDGTIFRETKIDQEAPDGIFSTLPVFDLVRDMKKQGIPCALSTTAGSFVCNLTLFSALRQSSVPTGFIHVPYLPEQLEKNSNIPSMPLSQIVEGLLICTKTISNYLKCSSL